LVDYEIESRHPAVPPCFPYSGALCRPLCWLILIAMILLSLPGYCRAADDAAGSSLSTTSAPPDQQMSNLLNKLREQIFAGHTTTPPSDNAVQTWVQVAALIASHLSPGAAEALGDFVRTVHSVQIDEEAAGRGTVAIDLSVFADFAVAALKDRPIENEPPSSAPPSSALPKHAIPVDVRTADIAGQSSLRSDGAATTPSLPPSVASIPSSVTAAALTLRIRETSADRSEEPKSMRQMSAAAAGLPAAPPPQPEKAMQPAEAAATAAYVGRGDQMLSIGDVSAARKFYDYAVRAGNADAAAKLAETYDPEFLHSIGVQGLQPDLAKAMALYRQAAALGDTKAKERLGALNQEAAR
jgi:hypothetical protein